MKKTNREKIRREFQVLRVKFEKINFKQVKLEFEKEQLLKTNLLKNQK